jgi:hypothetical protein
VRQGTVIPKIIHYCWFGEKELPQQYADFINEWKQMHGDWEVKEWTEHNFKTSSTYFTKAIERKKFANASNFARLEILKNNGGVYFDTDIKVLKPLTPLLNYQCFLGFEEESSEFNKLWVNNAVIGAEKNHPFIIACLTRLESMYDGLEQANESSPQLTTAVLKTEYGLTKYGEQTLNDGIHLVPKDFFYPIPWFFAKKTIEYEKHITKNTFCVHFWNRSWFTKEMMLSMIDDLQIWSHDLQDYTESLKNTAANELTISKEKDELLKKEKEKSVTLAEKLQELANNNAQIGELSTVVANLEKEIILFQVKISDSIHDGSEKSQRTLNELITQFEQFKSDFEIVQSTLTTNVNSKIEHINSNILSMQLDIVKQSSQTKQFQDLQINSIAVFTEKLHEKQLSDEAVNQHLQDQLNDIVAMNKFENTMSAQRFSNIQIELSHQKALFVHLIDLLEKKHESLLTKINEQHNSLIQTSNSLIEEKGDLQRKNDNLRLQIQQLEFAVKWYKHTYQNRRLIGIIKDRLKNIVRK